MSQKPKENKHKLVSFLRGFLSFIYYLVIVLSVFLLIGFVAFLSNPELDTVHTFKNFGLLYKLTPLNPDQSFQIIDSGAGMVDPKLDLLGEVEFKMRSRGLVFLYFFMIYLFIFLTLIIVDQLRKFLKTVESGNFFIKENIQRIRRIGFAIILTHILEILGALSLALFFKPISIQDMQVSVYWETVYPVVQKGFWGVFLGLVFLAIAVIFRLGAQLQEEQALTI